MRSITGITLLTICLALLHASRTQADYLASDLCYCYSDNMVGWAHEHKYYNKYRNLTYRWVNSCTEERQFGNPDFQRHCKDPAACEDLPDVTRYHCIDKVTHEHCNMKEARKDEVKEKVCVKDKKVIVSGDLSSTEMTGNLFGPLHPNASVSMSGSKCANVCNLAFGWEEQINRGLKPLCPSTYFLDDLKGSFMERPFTEKEGTRFGGCSQRRVWGFADVVPVMDIANLTWKA